MRMCNLSASEQNIAHDLGPDFHCTITNGSLIGFTIGQFCKLQTCQGATIQHDFTSVSVSLTESRLLHACTTLPAVYFFFLFLRTSCLILTRPGMDSLTVPTKALIMSMSGTALISSFSLAGMSACLDSNSTACSSYMVSY